MLIKYIPNALSSLRLILLIPFLISLWQQQYILAFYLFIIAGVTDAIDGWLARTFHWQSLLGSVIDPLADKLLVATSFISLSLIGILPWWLVSLVFLRDLTICFGVIAWYLFIQENLKLKPTILSKINTTLQLILVIICLFELAFSVYLYYFTPILITCTAITTTASFIDYALIWIRKASLKNSESPL